MTGQLVAKLDATANDVPPAYQVTGYPTIFLAKAGAKNDPVKFEGERTVDAILEFVRQQTSGDKDEL